MKGDLNSKEIYIKDESINVEKIIIQLNDADRINEVVNVGYIKGVKESMGPFANSSSSNLSFANDTQRHLQTDKISLDKWKTIRPMLDTSDDNRSNKIKKDRRLKRSIIMI